MPISRYPAMAKPRAPPPRMRSSITSRVQPLTSTGALPDRLGSSRTLNTPQMTAAAMGTSATATHRTGPEARFHAAKPNPTKAPSSRPNRRARFQPAIVGGVMTRLANVVQRGCSVQRPSPNPSWLVATCVGFDYDPPPQQLQRQTHWQRCIEGLVDTSGHAVCVGHRPTGGLGHG